MIGNNNANSSFKSLKDHKENLCNNSTVSLINPAKNTLACIRNAILFKIIIYLDIQPNYIQYNQKLKYGK